MLPAGSGLDQRVFQRVPKLALTVPEAVAATGIGHGTLRQAIRRGELPVKRAGRRIVIPRAALEEWLLGKVR